MELGNKIKSLRQKAGITQEKLAEELGVSFQTISKWENNLCLPDISMLPKLSIFFGITIDELFNLTVEQRLVRIENMLEVEQEFSQNMFNDTVDFLKEQLERDSDRGKIYSLLAHVYHHRVLSDCEHVDKYAKLAMHEAPEKKDCQWLFTKTENAYVYDWNVRNRHKIIDFYKVIIEECPDAAINYLCLVDNLVADHRVEEAREYLEKYKTLAGHEPFLVTINEGRILLAEFKVEEAKQKLEALEGQYPSDWGVMFELANFYAEICEYDKAYGYFEKAFELAEKPRYIDALEGMATIRELQGRCEEAVECWDMALKVLKEEHHLTEGETVRHVLEEKQRMQKQ